MRTRIILAAPAIACSACDAESEPTVTPPAFVSAQSQDATAVVNTVQTVDVAIADAASGNTDMVTLSGVLANAQGTFDRVNNVLLSAPHPTGVESSETEMCSATNEFSSAMKSGRAWIDDKKPSELVDYRKHWDQGKAWWNQAVVPIWTAAGSTPPTIASAPTAPPITSRFGRDARNVFNLFDFRSCCLKVERWQRFQLAYASAWGAIMANHPARHCRAGRSRRIGCWYP